MAYPPVTAVLVLAGVLLWGSAWVTRRRRDAPGADEFAVVAAVAGACTFAVALSLVLDLAVGVVLVIALLVAFVMPVPWLLFTLAYTGRSEMVSPGFVALVGVFPAVGLLSTLVIFGSRLLPWLTLPSQETAGGFAAVGVTLLVLLQWLGLLYAGALMIVASGAVLLTYQRYVHLDSMAGVLMGVFGTIPWLSLLFGFQVAGLATNALPRTVAVGFLVGGLAAGVGLHRYHLFRSVAAASGVGPTTVIEELDDGMFVTDEAGTIVEINPAAEYALNTEATALVGADIEAELDASLAELSETEHLALQTAEGRRLFEPEVSELADQHGHLLGYAVVLRDVTIRTNRQQRLEVLNRILRHNLRNTMNVMLGRAELLLDRVGDPDVQTNLEPIVDSGRQLLRLSEGAQEIERLLGDGEAAEDRVPLAPLVADVLEAAGATGPEVTAVTEVPEGLVFEGSEDLLRMALTHLVENAIQYNDSPDRRVELTASYDPDAPYPLAVSVLDNGPGIPETELQVIELGTETPLEHGSGLGLWAVRWAVDYIGGEIEFEHREPKGTAVSLRLPAADRVDVEPESAADGVTQPDGDG